MFTLIVTQSLNLSHDEWLANLFNSGLPSPELLVDFPRVIRQMLMSPFPTSSSSMLELSAWSIDPGQVSAELMYLSLLCQVRRFQLIHECSNQAVVQMANPGLDPIHASKFYMADMLQWSRLLTNIATPPCTPHPVSRPIKFHVRADTSFD